MVWRTWACLIAIEFFMVLLNRASCLKFWIEKVLRLAWKDYLRTTSSTPNGKIGTYRFILEIDEFGSEENKAHMVFKTLVLSVSVFNCISLAHIFFAIRQLTRRFFFLYLTTQNNCYVFKATKCQWDTQHIQCLRIHSTKNKNYWFFSEHRSHGIFFQMCVNSITEIERWTFSSTIDQTVSQLVNCSFYSIHAEVKEKKK